MKVAKIIHKKSSMAKAYVTVWCELIYCVWCYRCRKLFQGVFWSEVQLVQSILFTIANKLII